MARDNIVVTGSILTGVVGALTTPVQANGGRMTNDGGHTLLLVINGLGGAAGALSVVTIQQAPDPYGRALPTSALPTFSVATDTVGVFGPFPPLLYNQKSGASNGQVDIDFSATGANIECIAVIS